jgi:hypothetical protein
MRTMMGIGAALVLLLPAEPASAFDIFGTRDLNAPWCHVHSDLSGRVECSYYTYKQCMETRLGAGGSCEPNPAARVVEKRLRRTHRRRVR